MRPARFDPDAPEFAELCAVAARLLTESNAESNSCIIARATLSRNTHNSALIPVVFKSKFVGASGGWLACVGVARNPYPLPARSACVKSRMTMTLISRDLPRRLSTASVVKMSTLTEIEEAAHTLSAEDKEELLRHLLASLRKERGASWRPPHHYRSVAEALAANGVDEEPRKGFTPEEVKVWLEQSRGISVSGMTTDEHMSLMRGGGMSGFLFDSNVLLDLVTPDSVWRPWSEAQVAVALELETAFINPIIYAELAPAFPSQEALNSWLGSNRFRRIETFV